MGVIEIRDGTYEHQRGLGSGWWEVADGRTTGGVRSEGGRATDQEVPSQAAVSKREDL